MGIPVHPIFDITTEEGRTAERQYLQKYMKRQAILLKLVYGFAILFVIVLAIAIVIQHGRVE